MDGRRPLADWRSAAPYAALTKGDRHAFAWEWLRRLPAYRGALAAGNGEPAAFGLCQFEQSGLGVPVARPIWRGDVDRSVLVASAATASGGEDAFDAAALAELGSCCRDDDGIEHWLWSDGTRHIRLDVVAGTLTDGPVRLEYHLAGCARARGQADTLVRLIALARTRRIVRKLFAPEIRAPRWALILRTHDALASGASQRDIAEHWFGVAAGPRWRLAADASRRRAQRLVGAARCAAAADPQLWLDESFP